MKKQKTVHVAGGHLRFETTVDWMESPVPMDMKTGPSPGGAADALEVSRAVIYTWIKRDILHVVSVGGTPKNPSGVYISMYSLMRVKHVLDQLCEEWGTRNLQGYKVASELEKRLPQFDMFQDL